MNCELMLTYDTPALRQTGSRNLTGAKMLPTIWHTYMKLVIKYQISAINSCWEKCDEKYLGTDGRMDRQTEGRTEVKQYTPSCGAGYKKVVQKSKHSLPYMCLSFIITCIWTKGKQCETLKCFRIFKFI